MKNALNSVKVQAPGRNTFDLSHDVKMSARMGYLYPCLAMECIPGDSFRLGCENVIRMAPMLAPLMHRVDVRVEYFFVPNRILWDKWETWISNGGDNNQQVNPLPAHPYFKYGNLQPNSIEYGSYPLLDYMGLPDPGNSGEAEITRDVSMLPFLAYQKIWEEYYRDENLCPKNDYNLIDGDNSTNAFVAKIFKLQRRAWEADYFTKALPFAQKGAPVDIPLGDVVLDTNWAAAGIIPNFVTDAGTRDTGTIQTDTGANDYKIRNTGNLANYQAYDPKGSLIVDSTTINDLRLAFKLQEWLEKNARGGTRYSELIRSHFNVKPEDARLQRPEYIVGVKNPIQISEVLQTGQTDSTPQGNMAGHGISYSNGNYGKYYCSEHGYIIGIFSVMPKTAYYQGIPKHFTKFSDPTDLAWPSFAHIGEQEVGMKEIYAFAPTNTDDVFGYMPRYQEYKILQSRVAGEFKNTLDFWHMARKFESVPLLNQQFVEANPTTRIFAVDSQEEDNLYCQLMHHIYATRPLPVYGTPTF